MKILSRATIVLSFLVLILPAHIASAELSIVEVQIYGDKADNDFIKIYSSADSAVDISGYKLRKRTSSGSESSIRVFPSGSVILAKGYFLWANSKDDFYLNVGAHIWSSTTLAKNNSIALLNQAGEILDALAWGESQNPFVEGSPFLQNPTANQQLKRKLLNDAYQDTNNNSQDFYLFPQQVLTPPPPPPQPQTQTVTQPELGPSVAQTTTPQTSPPPTESKTTVAPTIQAPLRVDINTASAQELQKLVGVGQVLAQRIIDARPFYSVDELTKVRGIGVKTLADIKSQGTAWVDSSLRPPKIERETNLSEKGLAQIAEPIGREYSDQQSKKSLLVFIIALILAIFSSITILILKNKLKKI